MSILSDLYCYLVGEDNSSDTETSAADSPIAYLAPVLGSLVAGLLLDPAGISASLQLISSAVADGWLVIEGGTVPDDPILHGVPQFYRASDPVVFQALKFLYLPEDHISYRYMSSFRPIYDVAAVINPRAPPGAKKSVIGPDVPDYVPRFSFTSEEPGLPRDVVVGGGGAVVGVLAGGGMLYWFMKYNQDREFDEQRREMAKRRLGG